MIIYLWILFLQVSEGNLEHFVYWELFGNDDWKISLKRKRKTNEHRKTIWECQCYVLPLFLYAISWKKVGVNVLKYISADLLERQFKRIEIAFIQKWFTSESSSFTIECRSSVNDRKSIVEIWKSGTPRWLETVR